MSNDGMVTIESKHSVKDTIDRLLAALVAKGITVFARIDHAAGAASVNMPLRPTELIIFGNPRSGTPLMQSKQIIGLDLPLKVLGWQDAAGKVWLSYINPQWLARRYGIGIDADSVVDNLTRVLTNVTEAAVA
jgi:uncharacterized protein (DUF302 family)